VTTLRTAVVLLAALLLGACPGPDNPGSGGDASVSPDGDTSVSGTRWRAIVEDAPGALLSIWESPGGELWSVGTSKDASGPMVLRRTASNGWERLTTGLTTHLWWVHGFGDDGPVLTAGESGAVLEYDRMTGSFSYEASPTDGTIYGLWGASADDVWFVGGNLPSGPGVILRRRFGVFETVPPPAGVGANEAFFKVWGRAPNDLIIIGDQGSVLRWNGTTLSREAISGARLVTIHGQDDDVVVVGGRNNAQLFEASGAAWVDRSPPGLALLNGVFVAPDGRAAAAGMLGSVLERRNGAWLDLPYPDVFRDWHAVRIDSRGDVWVAGGNLLTAIALDGGTLLRFGPARADDGDGTWTVADATAANVPVADAAPDAAPDAADGTTDAADGTTGDADDDGDSQIGPDAAHGQTQQGDYLVVIGEAEPASFTPISDGSSREIVQGPQGGIHAEIVFRVTVPGAVVTNDSVKGAMQARAYVGDELVGFIDVPSYPVEAVAGVEDTYESSVIPIFFANNDAATYAGQAARLQAQFSYLGKTGTQEVSVLLVDDD